MKTFKENLCYFVEHINSIENTLPLVMIVTGNALEYTQKKMDEFFEKGYATLVSEEDDVKTYEIKPGYYR